MAPRSFPAEPEFRSDAERRFWDALLPDLPDDAVLFPGLRLSENGEDREADLVLAVPHVGIAVVEVKGGQVEFSDGTWTQTSRSGHRKTIRPVDQARRCRYLLRGYLDGHPRWLHGWPRLVHLVAFPFTSVPEDFRAPECPRSMVLGLDDLDHGYERITALLRQAYDQPPPPTPDQVEDLVECLVGRPPAQRDLVGEVAERTYACDLLTAQQGRVLDAIRLIDRVEVSGGAGSGKTWLAVEQARRWAAAGRRVALVCYSRGLAAYLARRVELMPVGERPAYVGTFHGLGVDWLGVPPGRDDDSDYWEHALPAAMITLAGARPPEDRFDGIVVDEGQDFADAWWPALLAMLRDPDVGGLYVFSDEGQRVFARHGRPPVPLAPVRLDENLRNTKQIAQTFGSLTAEQMRYRGGDGVPVRYVACATESAVGIADDQAVALLEGGWSPVDVALLTTGRRHPVHAEQQSDGASAYWDSYWSGEDVFYGHVLGFKGLERPAVVLAVNGFHDLEQAKERLYVGLSRARDLLVVCGDPDLIRQVGGPAVAMRLGIDQDRVGG